MSMTAKELAARLSLPGSLQQQVFSIPILPAQEQEWNELFLRDQEAFELRLHRHPTPELLALALYLRWAVATYRRYLTLGIPEAVFWDTFQDFALWSEECMRVTGQPGLIECSAAAYGALPAGAFGISTAHTSTGYRVRRSLPGCRHTNIGSTYSRGRAVLPA